MYRKSKMLHLLLILSFLGFGAAQDRVGTAAASFLEIGVGNAGNAMGDAYVSMAKDITALYWNPAGLGYMEKSEVLFIQQNWVADINMNFTAAGLVLPEIGTLALGLTYMGYGDMKVTTLGRPEGTGENFTASDFAFNLSFGRRLAPWFSFGASGKYILSQIWHSTATAIALDLGVIVSTDFFSSSGYRKDGMKIGMSISNYGTKMKYDGLDLLQPIDILPNEEGNYEDVPGQFRLSSWELPLIFRIGFAVSPIVLSDQKVTISVDALHPNNNSESLNVGGEYEVNFPGFGRVFLRGGYKAMFMTDSEYSATFGTGLLMNINPTLGIKIDYAFRSIGVLGNLQSFGFGFTF